MKTLKLFNAVVAKKSDKETFINDSGLAIVPNALWAKTRILKFYKENTLSGTDLNKTFHKSWSKILDSTRYELLCEQIKHYISTYGSNFQDEIYIPEEVLEVPDLKLKYKLVQAYTEEELIEKSLGLLRSGIALKEETVDDLITILVDELQYTFTGDEGIKNKEAIVKIADLYNIFPKDTAQFFRYIVYKATGETLLIKNKESIQAIKESKYNPAPQFNKFGLEKLAEVFNRYKPLFLAFKKRCPKTINKISKLSKIHHKPLVENPLNKVTSVVLTEKDTHWLDNATPYALFKAISACYARKNGQTNFTYRIRNGKSWTTKNRKAKAVAVNYKFLMDYIKGRFDMTGMKVYIPKDVKYALPTSEKMFVGNIPTGTKFYGDKLAVGIYWENAWGANDLDLSGINIGGKVGWNASYSHKGSLIYSGDITSAPNGAVEYLYARDGLTGTTLVQNNVFSGDENCKFKIIIGKGDGINKTYMMNPNNLFAEVMCESVQTQSVLGMLAEDKDKQVFVLLNFGAGQLRVSNNSELTDISRAAIEEQWLQSITFDKLLKALGATIVRSKEKSDYSLDLEDLNKNSFTEILEASTEKVTA
jgi:hypothetical protein